VKRLTDEQLMERLQQGQIEALDELYARYARKLYAFCYHTTHSADAQDLVQDVFERVIKAARTFNPQKAAFRTWMFSIARNHCIDVSRRRKRFQFISIGKSLDQRESEEEPALEDTLIDARQNVESSVTRSAVIEAVRDCINGLENKEEKQAIVLYYLGGKVYREIGEVLGKSTSMARNYIKSAQEKVKRCLESKGINSMP
jgi:RNA polymerase sigma-70 factor (ECF subfamily)